MPCNQHSLEGVSQGRLPQGCAHHHSQPAPCKQASTMHHLPSRCICQHTSKPPMQATQSMYSSRSMPSKTPPCKRAGIRHWLHCYTFQQIHAPHYGRSLKTSTLQKHNQHCIHLAASTSQRRGSRALIQSHWGLNRPIIILVRRTHQHTLTPLMRPKPPILCSLAPDTGTSLKTSTQPGLMRLAILCLYHRPVPCTIQSTCVLPMHMGNKAG